MPVPDSRRLTGRRVECDDVSSSTLPPPRLLGHAWSRNLLRDHPAFALFSRSAASYTLRLPRLRRLVFSWECNAVLCQQILYFSDGTFSTVLDFTQPSNREPSQRYAVHDASLFQRLVRPKRQP